MKFVPKYVRQSVDCLVNSTDVFNQDIQKATMEWIGVAIEVSRCVQHVRYERKLLRGKWVRKSDRRKVEKLFSGWGVGSGNLEVKKNVARQVSEERVNIWVEKEKCLREYEKDMGLKVKECFKEVPLIYKKLRDIRFQTV